MAHLDSKAEKAGGFSLSQVLLQFEEGEGQTAALYPDTDL